MMASKLRFFFCLPLWFLTIVIMKLEEVVATYKNRKTGEMSMSSIWKEVEEEGITKGIVQGKLERSSEITRNLLIQKILSKEEIAEATGLSLDEVREIAAGLC